MKKTVACVPRNEFALGFFAVVGADQEEPNEESNDKPALNRLLNVAEGLFPNDDVLARAFVARFWALMAVLDRDELKRWSRLGTSPGDTFYVHPALLSASAEVRLNKNGKFPIRLLTDAAERLEAEEFSDWEWPGN